MIASLVFGISCFLLGRTWERGRMRKRRPTPRWTMLPSGWSKDCGGLTIYAMTQDGNAYWWVARNGRTIIEGPSSTLDMAKIEAEREAHELSR